jgi:hypothetical protein
MRSSGPQPSSSQSAQTLGTTRKGDRRTTTIINQISPVLQRHQSSGAERESPRTDGPKGWMVLSVRVERTLVLSVRVERTKPVGGWSCPTEKKGSTTQQGGTMWGGARLGRQGSSHRGRQGTRGRANSWQCRRQHTQGHTGARAEAKHGGNMCKAWLERVHRVCKESTHASPASPASSAPRPLSMSPIFPTTNMSPKAPMSPKVPRGPCPCCASSVCRPCNPVEGWPSRSTPPMEARQPCGVSPSEHQGR